MFRIREFTKTISFKSVLLLLTGHAMFVQSLSVADEAAAQNAKQFPARTTQWRGYERSHFEVAGRKAYFVKPKTVAAGKPWVWRARFPDYHAEMDVALLGLGFHIAYVDVAGMFGSPKAVAVGNAFYSLLTTKQGFSKTPALEGVSRGGLFVYNWAARNPTKVACIYCDTPVCDFKSWPGGKGTGLGATSAWKQCIAAYEMTEAQALKFHGNPIDHAAIIAKSRIPILHIVAENDRVVPPKENTYLLQTRLAKHGHALNVISVPKGTAKSNGHHFTHPAQHRVVSFLARWGRAAALKPQELLRDSQRIVFLGDSITYAGGYVAAFDAWLTSRKFRKPKTVINVGLPSETVSGLSEDGHAGGRFPRPDLAERLDRVLAVTKPDLVLACYGINCGIYQPFDEKRFQRYQQGIASLKRKVEAAGATLVLVTPPSYDDQRARKKFSYNAVLRRYSQWLLAQRKNGWRVIDFHGPMTAELARRRKADPNFTFQPDAVHPNSAGHWFVAGRMVHWFSDSEKTMDMSPESLAKDGVSAESQKLVRQRMSLLRDAYLSAAGHKRPGIRKGLAIPSAERKAAEISKRITSSTNAR